MILSTRHRRRIARLCLLACCLLVWVQFAHGAHMAIMDAATLAEATAEKHSGGEHHCHSPAASATDPHAAEHHHDAQHHNVHQLMECDCLLCKLVQAPALAPAWQSDVLVQRSLQVSRDTLVMSTSLPPHTQPPSRAPPR